MAYDNDTQKECKSPEYSDAKFKKMQTQLQEYFDDYFAALDDWNEKKEKYEEYRKTISEEDAQTFYLYFNI